VRGPHDWPDYTIAANCSITSGLLLHKFVDSAPKKADSGARLACPLENIPNSALNPRWVKKNCPDKPKKIVPFSRLIRGSG
jgi:hypothetical protein